MTRLADDFRSIREHRAMLRFTGGTCDHVFTSSEIAKLAGRQPGEEIWLRCRCGHLQARRSDDGWAIRLGSIVFDNVELLRAIRFVACGQW